MLLLNFLYASDFSKQKNNIAFINKKLRALEVNLAKTKKTDVLRYTSIYDKMAELIIMKNEFFIKAGKEDNVNTDKIYNFALKYDKVEFIKTQFYKTPFHDDVAKTIQNLASLYELCFPPMAKKYLISVIRIKKHIYGKNSPEAAKALDALGDYYRIYMANFEKTIEKYKEAKKMREKFYGLNDARITENYAKLAYSIFYHGDKTAKAQKLLLSSIDIRKKAHVDKHYPLYAAYMDLGIYYSMKDNYTKSTIYLQKALKSFYDKINSNYIAIISELSQNYLNQNELTNALKYAKKAYKISKEFYKNETNSQVLENLNRLKEINNKLNR